MKNHINFIYTLVCIFIAIQTSFAHFGTKGPFGGSVSCSTVYDSTVYIGTFTGGVYESTNSKLVAWRPRPVGLKDGHITALAHTGKYLFAGTANGGVYVFNGYVSSDRYWIPKNSGLGSLNVTSLVAIDSTTLMVGTSGDGIYKTTDKGETWVSVNNSVLHHYDITGFVKVGNRIIHTAKDGGVWASDDMGASWFDFNDNNTLHIDGTNAISYNAKTDEIMIVNVDGLYKAKVGTGMSTTYGFADNGLPSGLEVRSISNNGDLWFLATDKGVYTSASSTILWTKASSGLGTDNINTLVPFKNTTVCGTTGEGIFKVNDMSAVPTITWMPINSGFNNLATYSGFTAGLNLAVIATEKGVFVSKNITATTALYVRANNGLTDSLNVQDVCLADFCLLAATKNAGVFFSADSGVSWMAINTGLMNMNIKKVFCKDLTKYAICSTGNVYISELHSSSWTLFTSGLPSGAMPTSMAFSGDYVIIGTMGQGVFKAKNGGVWAAINTGLSNLNVTSVTANSRKIYAGTDGNGVFVSDSGQVNWSSTAPLSIAHTTMIGLDGTKVQAMSSNGGYVFASYKGGLLATSDSGATWIAGGNQFNLPSFTDVNKIFFTTGRVFVTTQNNCLYSNGLSELPAITTSVNDYIEDLSVFSVSPNPSNGRFSIGGKIESIESVNIYDVQGVQVSFWYDKDFNDLQVYASKGIYFVKIKVTDKIYSRKIIIE